MSKKINQLDAASDAESANDSWLLAQAEPISGLAKKITVAQAKEVYGVKRTTYTATGAEGNTLTISALANRQILMVVREGAFLHEVGSSPDPASYTWDDTDIVLGAVTNPGERFIVLHRTY